MAIYPAAKYRPVVGESKDPPIIPIGAILHVDAVNARSLYNYFNGPSGGIESHFHIPALASDPIEQYRDTGREADANYRGNSWIGADGRRYGFISIETQGYADGIWNDVQLPRIFQLLQWLSTTHTFPLRRAPAYRSPGIGYHVMFGSGEGTNSWSNARGKVCPGPRRIAQFNDIILPQLARLAQKDPLAMLSDAEARQLLSAAVSAAEAARDAAAAARNAAADASHVRAVQHNMTIQSQRIEDNVAAILAAVQKATP